MNELSLADIEARMRRLERQNRLQNRLLAALLGTALALGSIAVSSAQPTIITATEVRAQRFSLLDPNGGLADDWYTTPTREGGMRHPLAPYSNWGFSKPGL